MRESDNGNKVEKLMRLIRTMTRIAHEMFTAFTIKLVQNDYNPINFNSMAHKKPLCNVL